MMLINYVNNYEIKELWEMNEVFMEQKWGKVSKSG